MKERPILFSTPMVKAILEGRKTQTRRIIKESFNGCITHGPHPCPNDPVVLTPGEVLEHPFENGETMTIDYPQVRAVFHCSTLDAEAKCPFGKAGDKLWVRETWALTKYFNGLTEAGFPVYKADYSIMPEAGKWKPAIHMPKDFARIWLEVESVGVEQLQDISEQDAKAEGVRFFNYDGCGVYENYILGPDTWEMSARGSFATLWQSINGPESWEQNPWVWVIKFKRRLNTEIHI